MMTYTVWTVLTLAAVIVFCTGSDPYCPNPVYDLCKCNIRQNRVIVSCSDIIIKKQIQVILENYHNIHISELIFRASDMKDVQWKWFQNMNVSKLILEDTSISFDGKSDSVDMGKTLNELFISNGELAGGLDGLRLQSFKRIQRLFLLYIDLPNLASHIFPDTLQVLELVENNISDLVTGLFSNLKDLESLSVKENNIQTVHRNLFPSVCKLTHLDMSYNYIKHLPNDFFAEMPYIKQVRLEHNKLTTISKQVWYPVWHQLHTVSLMGNELICDAKIRWIYESLEITTNLFGTCDSPAWLRDVHLLSLISEDLE